MTRRERKNEILRSSCTRKLYLVDIENIAGVGELTTEDANRARSVVEGIVPPSVSDLIIVGTSHSHNALIAACAWRGVRMVFRRGHDGADLALLAAMREASQLEGFSSVVLASGDGIFADDVEDMAASGLKVTVLSRAGKVSRNLVAKASEVITFSKREGAAFASGILKTAA